MIDPEYYPDIEDDDTLKLYIDAALKFVDMAAAPSALNVDTNTSLHSSPTGKLAPTRSSE